MTTRMIPRQISLVSPRRVLLLVLALNLLTWGGPAAAKQCEREEQNRLRHLERTLAHCGGDPDCVREARKIGK